MVLIHTQCSCCVLVCTQRRAVNASCWLWVIHGRWLSDIEPVRRSERALASPVLLTSSDPGSKEKSTAANQAAAKCDYELWGFVCDSMCVWFFFLHVCTYTQRACVCVFFVVPETEDQLHKAGLLSYLHNFAEYNPELIISRTWMDLKRYISSFIKCCFLEKAPNPFQNEHILKKWFLSFSAVIGFRE